MLDKGLSSPDVDFENVWIMASICDTCSNPAKVPSICVVTKNKYGRDVPHWVCGECMLKIQEKRTERKHGLVASLQEGE